VPAPGVRVGRCHGFRRSRPRDGKGRRRSGSHPLRDGLHSPRDRAACLTARRRYAHLRHELYV
jgi:hypothetical protein